MLEDGETGFDRFADLTSDGIVNNSDADMMADYFGTDGYRGSLECYYHYNRLGSVIALTDSAGSVVEKYKYDIFGQTRIYDSADTEIAVSGYSNPYMFTARRYDTETGLYYYRARMYNPYIGRFMQTDPIGYGDGLNWYAYCGNNSISFSDPLGLCATATKHGEYGALMQDYRDKDAAWLQMVSNGGHFAFPRPKPPMSGDLMKAHMRDIGFSHIEASIYSSVIHLTGTNALYDGVNGFQLTSGRKLDSAEAKLSGALGAVNFGFRAAVVSSTISSMTSSPGSSFPSTRADLHNDLISKGYRYKSTSSGGYVTYLKGSQRAGQKITIKPTGEVIPTQAGRRFDYSWNRLPDQAHTTQHYVEPTN